MMCRSVKVADLQAEVGDIIELASGSSEDAEGDSVPLALLQAMWQTKKGGYNLLNLQLHYASTCLMLCTANLA